jgi:hypothetical protein
MLNHREHREHRGGMEKHVLFQGVICMPAIHPGVGMFSVEKNLSKR